MEVTHMVFDYLEVDGVALGADDTNVTGVERARNRDAHGTSLPKFGFKCSAAS
jgi:hypothetical protein